MTGSYLLQFQGRINGVLISPGNLLALWSNILMSNLKYR